MATRRKNRHASKAATIPAAAPEVLESRRMLSAAPPLATAQDVDLAYDGADTLHLAFHDTVAHDLRYATRSPAGDWSDAVVIDASSADTGAQPSLAIDAAGHPGIAYRDAAGADLKYAHLGEGGAWVVETVEGHRRAETGVRPSLAFDAANSPVISYYRPAGRSLRVATVARGRWRGRNVARVGGPEHAANSLAINPATGEWAVAYERADGTVRYSEAAGRAVRTTVVDRLAAPGSRPSIAFDADGRPVFSYSDVTNAQVKLARVDDVGWNVSLVATTDGQGPGSTLLLDPDTETVQVVYHDEAGGTSVASATLGDAAFSTRSLDDATGGVTPVVVLDPAGETLVTAYAGDAAAVGSTLPAAEALTVAAASADSVTLTWSGPADGAMAFEVQQSDDSGATFSTVATIGAGATSVELSGLAEATSYAFRVVTCDAAGNRVDCEPVVGTTLPAAATDLAAPVMTDGRIELTWLNHSRGADAYSVERRAGDGSVEYAWDALATLPADATHYADDSVTAGTTYQYRVAALLGTLRNAGAGLITVSTPEPAPAPAVHMAAPGAPTATALSANSLSVAWRDNSGVETGYQVQWSVDGGAFKTIKTLGANTTNVAVNKLARGSTYRFRVRARGASGVSGFATTAPVTVAPAAPADLSAVALGDGSRVDLVWKDPGNRNDDGFTIERSTDGAPFVEVASVGAGQTHYVDSGLTPSAEYRYRVRSYGDWGTTGYTNVATESGTSLSPTSVTASVVSQTLLEVSWADNCPRETGYVVVYSDGVRSFEISRPAGSTGATLTGLTAGLDYSVQVVAVLEDGAEWGADPVTAVMLLAPTGVTAAAGDQAGENLSSAINVGWNDINVGESGYVIERSEDGGASYSFLATVGANATSYVDASLPEDAKYLYRLYAYNPSGMGATSAGVPNVPATWLNTPDGLTTVSGPGQIGLQWVDNSGAETGYTVAMSADGQTYYEIATVPGTGAMALSVTQDMFNHPLEPGAVYYFKVMAVSASNASDWSEPAAASTPV